MFGCDKIYICRCFPIVCLYIWLQLKAVLPNMRCAQDGNFGEVHNNFEIFYCKIFIVCNELQLRDTKRHNYTIILRHMSHLVLLSTNMAFSSLGRSEILISLLQRTTLHCLVLFTTSGSFSDELPSFFLDK